MRSLDGSITLYLELGHAQSLKGLSLAEHSYSLYKGQQYSPPKAMWTIEQKAKATAFGNWPRELATGDTRAQAIAAFKAKIDSTDMGPKPKGQTQFEIYRRRATGSDYIIGKKIGREHVDLKQLPDLATARKFMAENAAELEAALAKYKETPLERRPDKILPQMRRYSDLMAQMDADKNEAGAGADQLAEAWGKLSDERALAELMHDATLAQMDPAKELVDGDNAVQHAALRRRFEALLTMPRHSMMQLLPPMRATSTTAPTTGHA